MKDFFSNIDLKDLAIKVNQTLLDHDIQAVLVGGACVSIYTDNRYQSYDLDFITYEELIKIEKALTKLGFTRRDNQFVHKDCPYFIEFLNPPIAIGNEPVKNFEFLQTHLGTLKLLTPTDCVKDRLAAFYHWDDKQSLEQALLVAKRQDINLEDVKEWSEKEENLEKFNVFYQKLKIRHPD